MAGVGGRAWGVEARPLGGGGHSQAAARTRGGGRLGCVRATAAARGGWTCDWLFLQAPVRGGAGWAQLLRTGPRMMGDQWLQGRHPGKSGSCPSQIQPGGLGGGVGVCTQLWRGDLA